jgi:hypothetical protein
MSASGRYGTLAAAIGVVATAMAAWLVSWPEARPFAALGAASASLLGVVFGVWLVRVHGSAGTGVLRALAFGMLARAATLAGGTFLGLQRGVTSAWGFLIGFALAFTPLLALEIAWFLRRAPEGERAREYDVRS